RVDWPMRWAYEKNIFEPAGKDHHSQGGSFDTARRVSQEIYDWPAPVTFQYDFIGIKGTPGKMSSSKGKVVDLYDVLRVYQPEVARYLFAGTRPNTEFVISFDLDVIKIYEDYDKTERIAYGVDKAKNDDVFAKEHRIYELSQVEVMSEIMPYQIPFRHLCNLLQINSGDIDALVTSLGDVKLEQLVCFKKRCECAWYWITECAPEDFRFSLRFEKDAISLPESDLEAIKKLYTDAILKMDDLDEKSFGQALYAVAADCNLEPKALFTITYQVLIGKDQGPRLANFMKIIGKERLTKILQKYC
ncbi:MAG: lysine--tRNA ligase, partial [Treponemataceae bacterium]